MLRNLTRAQQGKTSYIMQYNKDVVALHIPRIAATLDVKAAIARALADALLAGYFGNLKELQWPFTHVGRGYMEDGEACKFDEPLWAALLETKPSLLV